jgi:hypothetical protein
MLLESREIGLTIVHMPDGIGEDHLPVRLERRRLPTAKRRHC